MVYTGGFCGDFADGLRCGACKLRFYCSDVCQKEDNWAFLETGSWVPTMLKLQGRGWYLGNSNGFADPIIRAFKHFRKLSFVVGG